MVAMPEAKKTNNPGYVTRAECAKTVTKFDGELKTIKKALVGEDLRAGIVKDIGDIKNGLEAERVERKKMAEQKWKPKDYVTLLAAIFALFGSSIAAYFAYISTII